MRAPVRMYVGLRLAGQARTVVELVVLEAASFQTLLEQFPDVVASISDAKEVPTPMMHSL